jgi:hypothetical protein
MKLFQIAAVLFAAGSSAWAAADPQLLGLLMPDAKMIAGVRLDQAKNSPFGQFVLSQAGPMSEFDKIKAETGFDPRTDMTEVVAGATGPEGGLVAGHGSFQPSRIMSLATQEGATVENYRGISLIGDGKPTGGTVAFLDGTTVVIGNAPLVKAAVDRWLSATRSSGALTAKAIETSSASHAWAVATGLNELHSTSATGTAPPEAQMLQNILSKINQVSGGLNFGDSIVMSGQIQAATSQDAQSLADVFQFLIAMAGSKGPLPATPQVSAIGTMVNFSMTITEQQVEQLFQPAVAARAARK